MTASRGTPGDPGAARVVDTPRSGLHARLSGPADAPLVLLSGSIGTDLHLWDAQVDALAGPLRLLAYDHPGHGRSPAPEPGAGIDELGAQVLALLEDVGGAVGGERVHVVGLSMGGLVAQWLAATAPERVDRVVLLCTDASLPPAGRWLERAAQVRQHGTGSLVGASRERWFGPAAAADPPPAALRQLDALAACDDEGYARCCEVLASTGLRDGLGSVAAPTLVVAGEQDRALDVDRLAALATALPSARLEVLPGCGHLPPVEQPDPTTALLRRHLLEEAHDGR